MTLGRRKKVKKGKVITLRMNKHSYNIIEEYAEARGLSVNAYLNSVADAQAEWFIPFSSYEYVTMPKKLLSTLFESANDKDLERMAQEWASEGRNSALLAWGNFTLESAIKLDQKVAKYLVGSDIKITTTDNDHITAKTSIYDSDNVEPAYMAVDRNRDDVNDNMMDYDILMVLRHDLGRNFSIFWARSGFHFYNMLESRKVSVSYDSTTVSIKLERLN